MKKVLAIILCVVLVLALAACASQSSSTPAPAESAAPAPRDCKVVTEIKTVKPTPRVQLAPDLNRDDRRLIFMRGER